MNKYETNYITKTCRKNRKKDTWIIKENTHKAIIEKKKYDIVQEIKQRKKGKNKTNIRKKDLNKIAKNKAIEIDKISNELIDNYKENDKCISKIEGYKNEIEKLERKKSVLYKKKCEQYITTEEFKIEYIRAKEEIEKFENLIVELSKTITAINGG